MRARVSNGSLTPLEADFGRRHREQDGGHVELRNGQQENICPAEEVASPGIRHRAAICESGTCAMTMSSIMLMAEQIAQACLRLACSYSGSVISAEA